MAASDVTVLVVPGYGGSGPEHWQTRWEARWGYRRVEQADWERPDPDTWGAALDAAVDAAHGPVALVAHSLGCVLVARWAHASTRAARVRAALLVAPADADEVAHWLDAVAAFAPVPLTPLPFPSLVVASQDDPYLEMPRARAFAAGWGAGLVDVGVAGHVNADSALGDWDAGHAVFGDLLAVSTCRTVYHLALADGWTASACDAAYAGTADDLRDGFLHCSTASQVAASAAKHRAGRDDVILVELDVAALGPALRWEPSRGGALFPHVHGPLPRAAVRRAVRLPLDAEGRHVFPPLAD